MVQNPGSMCLNLFACIPSWFHVCSRSSSSSLAGVVPIHRKATVFEPRAMVTSCFTKVALETLLARPYGSDWRRSSYAFSWLGLGIVVIRRAGMDFPPGCT